jgi:hypothetical protein
VFKKYKKLRKIKIYKKKKLRDQVGNLAIFLPINTGLHNTHKRGGNFKTLEKTQKEKP